MKILLCANNIVGLEVARFLVEQDENIVALAIHMPGEQKYTKEIIDTLKLPQTKIFFANQLQQNETIEHLKVLKVDLCISAFWAYLFKKKFIDIFPKGIINFHPSFLPFNRGKNPNVWPIIENTPCGVSLHYIDEGVDTGKIIAQKSIDIEPVDTGGTLYDKTLKEIVELFKEVWPRIKADKVEPFIQDESIATFHRGSEVDALDRIVLDKRYTAREFINKLRVRTYGDKSYAFFAENGNEIEIGIFLRYKNKCY